QALAPPGKTLEHHVGLVMTAPGTGNVPRYVFGPGTTVSQKARDSTALASMIQYTWQQHRNEVVQDYASMAQMSQEYRWPLTTRDGNTNSFAFESGDLYLAPHNVNHNIQLVVRTVRAGSTGFSVTSTLVAGTFEDTFDFDYSKSFPAPDAASVQA